MLTGNEKAVRTPSWYLAANAVIRTPYIKILVHNACSEASRKTPPCRPYVGYAMRRQCWNAEDENFRSTN